jgi:hypothetical protein
MMLHYKAARLVSVLPVGVVKDLYWRLWKTFLKSELDALRLDITNQLSSIGLRCCVCHSIDRPGATIYIESVEVGRKWNPPDCPTAPLPVPPITFFHNAAVVWPPATVSAGNALRLYDIVMAGTTEMTVPNRRHPRTQSPRQTVQRFGTAVQLCSLNFFSLLYYDWRDIPDVSEDGKNIITCWNYPSTDQSLMGRSEQIAEFICDGVISADIFSGLQLQIRLLALNRYHMAQVISRYLEENLALKFELMMSWDAGTENVFKNFAAYVTDNYLSRVGLQLCFDWSTDKEMKMFSIQTHNGRKWRGRVSVRLQDLYPFEYPHVEAVGSMQARMIQLIMTMPMAPPVDAATMPSAPIWGFAETSQPIATAVAVMEPMFPYGPTNSSSANGAVAQQEQLQHADLVEFDPGWTSDAPIVSVVVPHNYPACGPTVPVTSPVDGRIYQCPIPAGALPGSQFLIQIG